MRFIFFFFLGGVPEGNKIKYNNLVFTKNLFFFLKGRIVVCVVHIKELKTHILETSTRWGGGGGTNEILLYLSFFFCFSLY